MKQSSSNGLLLLMAKEGLMSDSAMHATGDAYSTPVYKGILFE
jgi:hypothetical protein